MIRRRSLVILLGLLAAGAGCSSTPAAPSAETRGDTVLGAGDALGWSVRANHAAARRMQHADVNSGAASLDH